MSPKVLAVVTSAEARHTALDPTHYAVNIRVTASDDSGDEGHYLSSDYCAAIITRGLSINEFNDAVIQAVIDFVNGSTEAANNSWAVDRDDVLVSGLFQRA